MKLSQQQLQDYDRDGVVFPVAVFSAAAGARFLNELESIADYCGAEYLKRFDNLHLFFDWAYDLVTTESLLDVIEDVLGSDILIYGSLVFYKPPHDSSYVSWHQDSFYSGLHLTPSTSAWIALTPSNQDNGCMRVIPGSHRQGSLAHDNVLDDPNLLNRRGERIRMDVDEAKAVDVVLRPGEMSLHQSTIVHGSNPNTADQPRVGFIVRFITSQMMNPQRPVMRVRGRADCSHLTFAEPPLLRTRASALATWRALSLHKD
jgi:ectoine hydroxylase-related dioxygenase (phytanoyl-CoA dioxygenase family)